MGWVGLGSLCGAIVRASLRDANKQEQFSSLIAILADVSQVAVSPSEDTDSNL